MESTRVDRLGNQKVQVRVALAVRVAHGVDRRVVDEERHVGAVIEVEAAREVLLGLASARVLDRKEPRDAPRGAPRPGSADAARARPGRCSTARPRCARAARRWAPAAGRRPPAWTGRRLAARAPGAPRAREAPWSCARMAAAEGEKRTTAERSISSPGRCAWRART